MLKYLAKLNYYSILMAGLVFVCSLTASSAAVYYFYSLNQLGIILSITTAVIIFAGFYFYKFKVARTSLPSGPSEKISAKFSLTDYALVLLYFISLITNFFLLYAGRTEAAIISPWQTVSVWFFAAFLASTFILIILLGRQSNKNNQYFFIFLISCHYFLSFSATWLVYRIGYGFDPFIHQATMDLIDKIGVVLPKPLYYLGHYGLIVSLHKLTGLSVVWLDKLLVPLLAAFYLPLVLYQVAAKWFSSRPLSSLLVLLILILPFSFLIVTTPQNLAYLLLILAILLGITCNNLANLALIYLLAAATLAIHPVAGIPAILFALFLTAYHHDNLKIRRFGPPIIFLLASFSLPLAFYFLEKKSAITPATEAAAGAISRPNLVMPGQENFILNFIYLYDFNLRFVVAALILLGLAVAWRYRKNCRVLIVYFNLAVAMLIAYLVTSKLPFNFLISYERDDYAARILLMSAFFFLPFIIILFYWFLERTFRQNIVSKFIWLSFGALVVAVSLYLSYPRFDRYFNSHGYSVSRSDINAVTWIEQNSSADYIVLANQQVSAAALREFGFSHYYQNNIFYYPIPTGGELYQYYLAMVYQQPSRQTMLAAMNLAGVKEGYFVLNKYWWSFAKILDEAKLEADSWQKIDNGQVYIFKYSAGASQ